MTERERGAVGIILDKELLLAAVCRQISDPVDKAWAELYSSLNVLFNTREGLAVVISEGVGHIQRQGLVKVEVVLGTFGLSIAVPIEDVLECATGDDADLADVVRVFGARLEDNFWIWRRQITDRPNLGTDKEMK